MTDVGDRVTLTWALGSSATVVATVRLPDGTSTTPAVTGSSSYAASLTTSQVGLHVVSWLATGATVAAFADVFYVDDTSEPGIVSLADVREELNLTATSSETALRRLILVASDICERRTGSIWRRTTVTAETRNGPGVSMLQLRKSPSISVTSVTESGIALTAGTDYVAEHETGRLWRGDATSRLGWESGIQNVVVSYVAGPAGGIVPGNISHGVLMQIQHLWDTRRGGSGSPRQAGSDFEYDPRSGYTIPRRVLEVWGLDMPELVG